MKNQKCLQIRLSSEDYERIRNKAQARGYKTLSSFMRHLALERDLLFEQKFDEIYGIIVKKLKSADKINVSQEMKFH